MGDHILFTRNDTTLGVRNGMLGKEETVGDAKLTVRLDVEDGHAVRQLTFKPREFPSIDHGFAVSIHRSQGCTVDKTYVLSSQTMDKSLTYVALTRHKEETTFYTAPDIAPRRSTLEQQPFVDFKPRPCAPTRSR